MNSKLKETIKNNKLLYRFAIYSKAKLIIGLYKVGGLLFKTNKQKAVFISFGGKSYSCNPRAVSEELHKIAPEFRIVWLFSDAKKKKTVVPEYIKCVEVGTLRAYWEQIKAGFWIDNFNKHISTCKKSDQIYIQLYHGDRGFKKILYDSHKASPNDYYIEQDICDLMLSGSEYYNRVIESAFKFNGEVMMVGSPRNDLLLNYSKKDITNIKKAIGLSTDIKVLMYAPTLRRFAQGKEQELADIDLESTLDALENKTKQRWICIIRAHSAVKGFANSPENSNQIIDVTKYEDMRDLLLITDLLITDYSSSAGDFALLKRPIILYQSDRERYLRDDRTFYFDIDTSPFTVVFNQEQLSAAIQELDEKTVEKQCEQILEFYGTVETGHAAKSVVEYILSKTKY